MKNINEDKDGTAWDYPHKEMTTKQATLFSPSWTSLNEHTVSQTFETVERPFSRFPYPDH